MNDYERQLAPPKAFEATMDTEATELVDNLRASMALTFREEHTLSTDSFNRQMYDKATRFAYQNNVNTSRYLKPEVSQFAQRHGKPLYSDYDFDMMVHDLNKLGFSEQSYTAQKASWLKEQTRLRGRDVSTMSRSTPAGKAGMFLGGMGTLMTDPVDIGLGFVLSPAATTAKKINNVRKLSQVFAAGVVAETVKGTTIVTHNKKELGVEYGAKDIAENALMAGAGGLALQGLFDGFGAYLKNTRAEIDKMPRSKETIEAKEAIDSLERDMEFAKEQGDEFEGLDKIDRMRKDVDSGKNRVDEIKEPVIENSTLDESFVKIEETPVGKRAKEYMDKTDNEIALMRTAIEACFG